MAILINGDIYIKIKPEIIEPDINEIKKIEDDLYDLSFEEAQNGLSGNQIRKKENLEDLKRKLLEQQIDYDTTETFHILKIYEKKFGLICFNRLGTKKTKICDLKELREKYIRMIDFLEEAEYIGKKFRRTTPLEFLNNKLIDYIYEEKDTSTRVLYKTDYAMLAEYTSKNSHYLEMIKPAYFEDEKYIFVGKRENKYDNKKEIYKDIVDEIEYRYEYYKKYYKK